MTGVIGPGPRNVTIAITAVWWAGHARIVRGFVLAETGRSYVEGSACPGRLGRITGPVGEVLRR